MSASWKGLSREARLRYSGDVIRVACGENRFQEAHVDDSQPGMIRLWSRVATRAQISLERPEIEAWLINRYRELVGFKIAERGTIIGEAWVPTIDLTADEWSMYVHTLAKACDRLEFLWTGRDVE